MTTANLFTALCLGAGSLFFLAGTLGILRFPDVLSRLHAVTKADNLGLGLVVLGLAVHTGSLLGAMKLVLIWILALVASATSSYLIASSVAGSDSSRPPGE
jgi:multicomponent Na+:H+ antiporter subunit G